MKLSRSREWLINAALVAASIFLCVLLLEAGARVYERLYPQVPNNRYAFSFFSPSREEC
jgi:hypothetical protein